MIPDVIANELVNVFEIVSKSSPKRYATPQAAAQPALIAPQYADNLPIKVFWCIEVRLETH